MGVLYAILIITGIGLVAGLILAIASKFMAVPVDQKVAKIRETLPGANCGACGFSGCDGYAAAIAAGEAAPNLCTPGGQTTADDLSKILGVEIKSEKKVAFVRCNHGIDKAKLDFGYSGAQSCAAASLLYGGQYECKFACLGFGDCAKACEYGAISLEDGSAKVNREICIACGKCATVCPKGIIDIIPAANSYSVACSNTEKGAVSRKKCEAACIGCMKCVKVCEAEAISVKNNLASIDFSKCTSCGKCAEVCPDKCIVLL